MDRKPVKAKSHANIAIIKYWGKRRCKTDGPFDQFDFVDLREYVYRDESLSLTSRCDCA